MRALGLRHRLSPARYWTAFALLIVSHAYVYVGAVVVVSFAELNSASLMKKRSRMNDGRRSDTKKNVVVRLFMELLMIRDRVTAHPKALGREGTEMMPVRGVCDDSSLSARLCSCLDYAWRWLF